MHHHFVLCVFPNLTARPIKIGDDYSFELDTFCADYANSDYALFYVSPSLVQILPDEGIITLPEIFTTNVPDFRLQFFNRFDKFPKYIFRLYPKTEDITPKVGVTFLPWNIAFDCECDISLLSLKDIFQNNFCVETEDFLFEFEDLQNKKYYAHTTIENGEKNDSNEIETDSYFENIFPLNDPIADHRDVLKTTKVYMNIIMNKKAKENARRRMKIIEEIIQTERNYVNELDSVCSCFTETFFQNLNISDDVYRRTFKSIGEIKPVHDEFLKSLEKNVGLPGYIEASIGKVFMQFSQMFKIASPHVCNFAQANDEVNSLLNNNKAFFSAVQKVLVEHFDGKNLESILVTPVQRLPRYPLLLRDLIKCTTEHHWDYMDIKTSLNKIQELVKSMDNKKHETDELNFVLEVQAKLNAFIESNSNSNSNNNNNNNYSAPFQVVKTGRRGLAAIENLKINKEFKGSIFLFNDAVLIIRYTNPVKCIEESLITTRIHYKVIEGVSFLIINDSVSLQVSNENNTINNNNNNNNNINSNNNNNGNSGSNNNNNSNGNYNNISSDSNNNGASNSNNSIVSEKMGNNIKMFIEKFNLAKRELIMKQCSYGNALAWSRAEYVSSIGPPLLTSPSMVYIDDSLYLFGGKLPDGSCTNDLWLRKAGLWSLLETINTPCPRFGCSMCPYIVFNDDENSDSNENTTINSNNNSNEHNDFEESNVTNKFVVFGGQNAKKCFSDLLVFDINTKCWSLIEAEGKPSPRSGHTASLVGTQLWVFGGRLSDDTFSNELFVFDFSQNIWYQIKKKSSSENNDDHTNGNNKYEGDSPDPRAWCTSFWINDEDGNSTFAIFGGGQNGRAFDDLWIFSYDENEWIEIETEGELPFPRFGHVGCVLNNALYVIGGTDARGIPQNPQKLDMETVPYEWSNLPQCDEPDTFTFSTACAVPKYGIALFGHSTGFVKIRLRYDESEEAVNDLPSPTNVTTPNNSTLSNNDNKNIANTKRGSINVDKNIQSVKNNEVIWSAPSFNVKNKSVTLIAAKENNNDTNNVANNKDAKDEMYLDSFCIDDKEFVKVCRVMDNVPFWRKTAILEMDGTSALYNAQNKFVLNEDDFNSIPVSKQFAHNDEMKIFNEPLSNENSESSSRTNNSIGSTGNTNADSNNTNKNDIDVEINHRNINGNSNINKITKNSDSIYRSNEVGLNDLNDLLDSNSKDESTYHSYGNVGTFNTLNVLASLSIPFDSMNNNIDIDSHTRPNSTSEKDIASLVQSMPITTNTLPNSNATSVSSNTTNTANETPPDSSGSKKKLKSLGKRKGMMLSRKKWKSAGSETLQQEVEKKKKQQQKIENQEQPQPVLVDIIQNIPLRPQQTAEPKKKKFKLIKSHKNKSKNLASLSSDNTLSAGNKNNNNINTVTNVPSTPSASSSASTIDTLNKNARSSGNIFESEKVVPASNNEAVDPTSAPIQKSSKGFGFRKGFNSMRVKRNSNNSSAASNLFSNELQSSQGNKKSSANKGSNEAEPTNYPSTSTTCLHRSDESMIDLDPYNENGIKDQEPICSSNVGNESKEKKKNLFSDMKLSSFVEGDLDLDPERRHSLTTTSGSASSSLHHHSHESNVSSEKFIFDDDIPTDDQFSSSLTQSNTQSAQKSSNNTHNHHHSVRHGGHQARPSSFSAATASDANEINTNANNSIKKDQMQTQMQAQANQQQNNLFQPQAANTFENEPFAKGVLSSQSASGIIKRGVVVNHRHRNTNSSFLNNNNNNHIGGTAVSMNDHDFSMFGQSLAEQLASDGNVGLKAMSSQPHSVVINNDLIDFNAFNGSSDHGTLPRH